MALASAAQLAEALRTVPVSSFAAGVLQSSARDGTAAAAALLLAEVLIAKLPDVFKVCLFACSSGCGRSCPFAAAHAANGG